ncbi:MAG: hypothetical protein HKN03_14190 [Acidimicrobiales bacterium]|nr:hypothetical protein [Acidimicrobiales bacterium]
MRIRTSLLLQLRKGLSLGAGAAAVLMTLGMFLGWFVAGTRVRNSFEMFRIPQQLGLEGFTTIRVGWFLLPVVAVGVLGFVALGRLRPAAALLALQSFVSLCVGVIVVLSPINAGAGPAVTILGGGAGLVVAAGLLVVGSE